MDALKQNLDVFELTQRIKDELVKNQHRYELRDHFANVTYRLSTAHEAMATAEKIGSIRFQEVTAAGQVSQINLDGGEWKREDGKRLAEIQADIDKENLSLIEARSLQRKEALRGVVGETDELMAKADAYAFRRIQDPALQRYAAVTIDNNTFKFQNYENALETAVPGYRGIAEKISLLAKDARKDARYEAEFTDYWKTKAPESVGPSLTNIIEVTQHIKQDLAENQHRYELYDKSSEILYRLPTANEAVSTAEKIGSTRFQEVTAAGQVTQINLDGGEWKREDGIKLDRVQADIDDDSLLSIQSRSEQFMKAVQGITPLSLQCCLNI